MSDVSVPYTLETPAGTLTFNNGATDGYRLTNLNGMGAAPIRGAVLPLAARDGAVVMDGFQDALYPVLEGVIDHTSAASRATLEQKLEAWIAPLMRADGILRWWGYGANLVENGGIETNTTGWVATGGATLTRDTTQATQGVASLKVVTPASASSGAIYVSSMGVLIPGVAYTATFAVLRSSGTGTLEVAANTVTSANAFVATSGSTTFTPTGSWATYQVSFTAPATASGFQLFVWSGSNTVAQTYFVDAVKVEPTPSGAAASAYVEPAATGYAEPKQRTVRLLTGPAVGNSVGLNPRPFQVAFVAGDPLAYGQRLNTSADITINGSSVSVTNAGNRPTPPTIRVYGAVTDPTVTNQTTGGSVTFTGVTLAAGQILEIRSREEIAQTVTNKILNGYFDTNASNWSTTGTSFTRDTVTKRSGSGSGKTVTSAQFQATGSDNFTLTGGVTYEVVAWVNAPASRSIIAFVQNSTFTNVLGSKTIVGNGSFQEVRFTFTPTVGGSYILYFRDEGTGGTTFYIDDVEIIDPQSPIKIPTAASTYPWLTTGANSIIVTGTSVSGAARGVVCHRNAFAS